MMFIVSEWKLFCINITELNLVRSCGVVSCDVGIVEAAGSVMRRVVW